MSKLQKSLTEKYDLSIREKSISREKLPKILANATDGRQRQSTFISLFRIELTKIEI